MGDRSMAACLTEQLDCLRDAISCRLNGMTLQAWYDAGADMAIMIGEPGEAEPNQAESASHAWGYLSGAADALDVTVSELLDQHGLTFDPRPKAKRLATVTNKQIRALRQEAGNAGDAITVAICDVALATRPGQIAEIDESVRGDLEIMGIVPEHVGADVVARAKVAEMIEDAAIESGEGATSEQIKAIRARAYNAIARQMASDGVKLTWAQADDLGDEALDWMRSRLGLKIKTTDRGVTGTPSA